jgi:hypothetical protein
MEEIFKKGGFPQKFVDDMLGETVTVEHQEGEII